MQTIEERANDFCKNMGGNPKFKSYYLVIAAEQDRIARQEERERCIKAAQDWYCKNVCFVKECVIIESCCKRHEDIRKAIEEGGNQ